MAISGAASKVLYLRQFLRVPLTYAQTNAEKVVMTGYKTAHSIWKLVSRNGNRTEVQTPDLTLVGDGAAAETVGYGFESVLFVGMGRSGEMVTETEEATRRRLYFALGVAGSLAGAYVIRRMFDKKK